MKATCESLVSVDRLLVFLAENEQLEACAVLAAAFYSHYPLWRLLCGRFLIRVLNRVRQVFGELLTYQCQSQSERCDEPSPQDAPVSPGATITNNQWNLHRHHRKRTGALGRQFHRRRS